MSEMPISHNYGAEHLKAKSAQFTFWAVSSASLIILLAFLYPMLLEWYQQSKDESHAKAKATKVINYAELSAPPPIELEQVKPPPKVEPVQIKTVKFLQPVAKKDEEVFEEEELPSMEEMETTQIATFDQEGVDSIVFSQDIVDVNPEPEPEPYTYVEIMPEFVGGYSKLVEYLSNNLTYPPMAMDAGIEGTVYVGFVIEGDGSITNVKILRGVHSKLDEEAINVISKMPKWKPGVQNNNYVRVSYTIPVAFKIM